VLVISPTALAAGRHTRVRRNPESRSSALIFPNISSHPPHTHKSGLQVGASTVVFCHPLWRERVRERVRCNSDSPHADRNVGRLAFCISSVEVLGR
jgi:hypothetical protein